MPFVMACSSMTADMDTAARSPSQIRPPTGASVEAAGLAGEVIVLSVDATRNSAALRLSGGRRATLPWTGMNWAAGFIDRNRIHAKPESVTEVVSPGDVLYVIETVTGDFDLRAALKKSF